MNRFKTQFEIKQRSMGVKGNGCLGDARWRPPSSLSSLITWTKLNLCTERSLKALASVMSLRSRRGFSRLSIGGLHFMRAVLMAARFESMLRRKTERKPLKKIRRRRPPLETCCNAGQFITSHERRAATL